MNEAIEPMFGHVIENNDTVAIVIPREIASKLGFRSGCDVQVAATAEGMVVSQLSDVVKRQVEIARQVMRERHDVLKRLAE